MSTSINFTGLNNASVCGSLSGNVPCLTNASFGDFFVSALDGGSTFMNGTFVLNLVQSSPVPTGGSPADFNGAFTGSITSTTSGVAVTFNGANQFGVVTAVLGDTTYTLPSFVLLVPPTTNGGDTTLQGQISYTPASTSTPEPTTFALMGGAFIGLGFLRKRAAK